MLAYFAAYSLATVGVLLGVGCSVSHGDYIGVSSGDGDDQTVAVYL